MLLQDYICPYCGASAEICDSSRVYPGKNYGRVLVCSRFPECDSYVGCHTVSGCPKGTMANAELRILRKEAHTAFDKLWKHKRVSRTQAYTWLAKVMSLSKDQAHIGLFNPDECRKLLTICKEMKVL